MHESDAVGPPAAEIEMPRYESHKKVWALEIALVTGHRLDFAEKGYAPTLADAEMFSRYTPVAGDFYVQYDDGYKSFSPRKAFLEGYTPAATGHAGLPVAGYKPQSDAKVNAVNANKECEERILRVMDTMRTMADVEQRWLALARTQIEQGFMALNRSIFQPGRAKVPEDGANPTAA